MWRDGIVRQDTTIVAQRVVASQLRGVTAHQRRRIGRTLVDFKVRPRAHGRHGAGREVLVLLGGGQRAGPGAAEAGHCTARAAAAAEVLVDMVRGVNGGRVAMVVRVVRLHRALVNVVEVVMVGAIGVVCIGVVVREVVRLTAQRLHIRPVVVGNVVALRIFFRRRELRVDGSRWVGRRRRVHQKRGTHDHHTPLIIFEVNFDAQIIPLSSRFRLQFRLQPTRRQAPPKCLFCRTHVTGAGTNQRGERADRAGFAESTSLSDSDELLATTSQQVYTHFSAQWPPRTVPPVLPVHTTDLQVH